MSVHDGWLDSFKSRVDCLRAEILAARGKGERWSGSIADTYPSSLRELQREILTRLSWHKAESADMIDFPGFKTLVEAANYLYPPESQAHNFAATAVAGKHAAAGGLFPEPGPYKTGT